MMAAGRALGENSPVLSDSAAALLPSLKDLPTIARKIALEVGIEAQQAGRCGALYHLKSCTIASPPRSGLPIPAPRSSRALALMQLLHLNRPYNRPRFTVDPRP